MGPVLHVQGADLVDGTPIFDIKPYLSYTDSHPDARGGFTDDTAMERLAVEIPPVLLDKIPQAQRPGLIGVLENDPRPRYQDDESRVYGLRFAERNVRFTVSDRVLTVVDVQ